MMLLVTGVIGATAIDNRARRLARRTEGGIGLGYPLSAPMMRARAVFASVEPWEEAFRWMGTDPEKAASARYVALWTTGILLATALLPILLRQMA